LNATDALASAGATAISRACCIEIAAAKALSPDGVVVMQFNGAPAGQTVFHLHFHIIPRWEGETLKGHGAAPKGDIGELQTLAEAIAAAL